MHEALYRIFRIASRRVPAYRALLAEAGIVPDEIKSEADFAKLPILEKKNTFSRFDIEQLCVDGQLGQLGSVLTSSGHSGVFAFGLTESSAGNATAQWIDDLLDYLFAVKSKRTLLINCLPMGVKVPTQACTLAETSVRPDMVVGLAQAFGRHYDQLILVGEAAFLKLVGELGVKQGVDWSKYLVQAIVGEEPLAENARKYLQGIFQMDPNDHERGIVLSSMGVAELGLNLFSEAPPLPGLVALRRVFHETTDLRTAVFGNVDWVPSLFTYDPQRIHVEFDSERRLLVTTLDPRLRIPLIRYATGDRGRFIEFSPSFQPALKASGASWQQISVIPIVAIEGRGQHAFAGTRHVYPEAVKEGLYFDPALAALTTANFRLLSGNERVLIRIQLSPGIAPDTTYPGEFSHALSHYIRAPFEVACEAYEAFGSGMALDYERKFNYLEHAKRNPSR